MSKDSLDKLRHKIEALDIELLRLLNQRASASLLIGKLKAQQGLDIRDPWREQVLFSYLTEHNEGPLKAGEIEEIFQKICF